MSGNESQDSDTEFSSDTDEEEAVLVKKIELLKAQNQNLKIKKQNNKVTKLSHQQKDFIRETWFHSQGRSEFEYFFSYLADNHPDVEKLFSASNKKEKFAFEFFQFCIWCALGHEDLAEKIKEKRAELSSIGFKREHLEAIKKAKVGTIRKLFDGEVTEGITNAWEKLLDDVAKQLFD
eukprot:TRINITY_DN3175_c0_g1_i1.p1 TRINITY_DN3175_c0_g1~~TRINITY_DN3175_c0_g1_i1.p1  ORF type:complete len:178 (+),score=40.63 TRINITY_DN3175_c0_g1_i1:90-623(+)